MESSIERVEVTERVKRPQQISPRDKKVHIDHSLLVLFPPLDPPTVIDKQLIMITALKFKMIFIL
jgi:hypothetical protein